MCDLDFTFADRSRSFDGHRTTSFILRTILYASFTYASFPSSYPLIVNDIYSVILSPSHHCPEGFHHSVTHYSITLVSMFGSFQETTQKRSPLCKRWVKCAYILKQATAVILIP